VANIDNLVSLADRTTEEQREIARQGGIASGKARQEKATMKKALEMLLNETNKKAGKTYRDLATLGLIKGAIDGKAENYKTIVALLGELQETTETPQVNINIVDNSNLENALYEGEKE
jgi:hypothetical protein